MAFTIRLQGRRWNRPTIAGLMVLVALSAAVFNRLRPLSTSEAIGLAEARFRKVPGATKWIGRHRPEAKWMGDFWYVNFVEPETGEILAQCSVFPEGRVRAMGIDSRKFAGGDRRP